jgi:hypothetical protein
METVYLVCALSGGTLLVCQFVLGLLGLGGEHDLDGDHDLDTDHEVGHDHTGATFLTVLTFRTVTTSLAFFGLAGLAAGPMIADDTVTFGVALAAGAAALVFVVWLMKSLHKLKADGTARVDRALGQSGTVYLTVPGQKSGVGKVTLALQNRTVELQAVTQAETLPTGSQVVVVSVLGPDTVEVVSATPSLSQPERSSHA